MVDPAGQAAAFVMRSLASRRITRASFVRPAFLKSVETALRFGVPLLVDEAEHLDPVLNGVLNRESRRAGGRVLVTLGDSEVDVSPHFLLFLATRDATATFSPDLCSRVTLVNFSVTAGGLEAQCVEALLQAERPDAHARARRCAEAAGRVPRLVILGGGEIAARAVESQGEHLR